jgi:hypothetical protein
MTSTPAPAMLDTEQTAARIGVTATALRYWRHHGEDGPPHIRVGKKVLYPADLVEKFIEQLRDRAAAGA